MTTQRNRSLDDRAIDRAVSRPIDHLRRLTTRHERIENNRLQFGTVKVRYGQRIPRHLRLGSYSDDDRVYAYDVEVTTRGASILLRNLRTIHFPAQGTYGETPIRVGDTVVVSDSLYVLGRIYLHPISDTDPVTEVGM